MYQPVRNSTLTFRFTGTILVPIVVFFFINASRKISTKAFLNQAANDVKVSANIKQVSHLVNLRYSKFKRPWLESKQKTNDANKVPNRVQTHVNQYVYQIKYKYAYLSQNIPEDRDINPKTVKANKVPHKETYKVRRSCGCL